jgi:hypothetical protein
MNSPLQASKFIHRYSTKSEIRVLCLVMILPLQAGKFIHRYCNTIVLLLYNKLIKLETYISITILLLTTFYHFFML